MVKVQARKEKYYNGEGVSKPYTWDVWLDTTVETTYIRHYSHTARLLEGMTEDHADKVVNEINNTVTTCVHSSMRPRNKDLRND